MKEDGEKEKKSVFRPEPASGLISKVYLAGSCLRHNGRQEEGGICIYMVGTLGNEGPPSCAAVSKARTVLLHPPGEVSQ